MADPSRDPEADDELGHHGGGDDEEEVLPTGLDVYDVHVQVDAYTVRASGPDAATVEKLLRAAVKAALELKQGPMPH